MTKIAHVGVVVFVVVVVVVLRFSQGELLHARGSPRSVFHFRNTPTMLRWAANQSHNRVRTCMEAEVTRIRAQGVQLQPQAQNARQTQSRRQQRRHSHHAQLASGMHRSRVQELSTMIEAPRIDEPPRSIFLQSRQRGDICSPQKLGIPRFFVLARSGAHNAIDIGCPWMRRSICCRRAPGCDVHCQWGSKKTMGILLHELQWLCRLLPVPSF